jgi:hypothetical protein
MTQTNNDRAEAMRAGRSKAFFAAAGAGDLAMETLRSFAGRLAQLQEKADWAGISGRVFEYVTLAGAKAVQFYDELAERGMEVAERAPVSQRAAAQLEQAARSTASATIAAANRTATAARKSAQTAARAAGQAAGATTTAAARRANGRQPGPQSTRNG